jgi:hypothetical protein
MSVTTPERLYGTLARFDTPEELLSAADELRQRGDRLEAYSPFPVEGLSRAIGKRPTRLPWAMLAGAILGGTSMYALQVWINLSAYPMDVGGRPLHSWPAFLPATFDAVVLTASFFGFFGLLYACGLPRLRHPLHTVPAFRRASVDGFFLCVRSDGSAFDPESARVSLERLGAKEVWHVPQDS